VKILLDENLPESLVPELRRAGHEATSINRLRLKGTKNGTLYREVAHAYDIFFTKDAGFARSVRLMKLSSSTAVKVLRVALQQDTADIFVPKFMETFIDSDFSRYKTGDDWP